MLKRRPCVIEAYIPMPYAIAADEAVSSIAATCGVASKSLKEAAGEESNWLHW
jgi:hypothetical protein